MGRMTLTVERPRIMIVGKTMEQINCYIGEVILKDEIPTRRWRWQLETEDAIYYLKTVGSMIGVRGYRNFKEVRLLNINKVSLGEHYWTLVFAVANYDKDRVRGVRI